MIKSGTTKISAKIAHRCSELCLYALMAFGVCGCTIIEISDKDGLVNIERRFGFTSISASPTTGLISSRVVNLGYISTPLGHTFGYGRHEILLSDQSCKVVIWVDEQQDLGVLKERLEPIQSICYSR